MFDKVTRLPPDLFFIDKKAPVSLQAQLITCVVTLVLQQQIPAGTRMPSSRSLASFLGISRLTVTLAYNELVAQNYLVALPRSGYAISHDAPKRQSFYPTAPIGSKALDWSTRLRPDRQRQRAIVKRRDWEQFPFPFLYGQMDWSLFNHAAWRDCARRALGLKEFDLLAGDWASEDDPMLIDHICTRTLPRRGIQATPDEVLITMGAQNALWMIIDLLKHDGRLAVYEDPGYPDIPEMLRFSEARSLAVTVDNEGINPDSLPNNTGYVFVTPSHHVPTGVTMPMQRRRELLKAANDKDFLIVEDDYEFEIGLPTSPSPALKSIDTAERVIYVGSFSKSIFPGLRLGYMVAPEPFIRQARALRAMMLRHPPGHMQRTTAYFLAQGYYDALIVKMGDAMRERRERLYAALSQSDFEIISPSQYGGTSLWVKADERIDCEEFSAALAKRGVLIEAGTPFFENSPKPCPYFRMGYSVIQKDAIEEGVAVMVDCHREMMSQLAKEPEQV
ncbi:PLP-dependent aminotransferase family protein [Rhodobacteraceae bacterium RKSG542]|uniref:MocR-like pyridoxine biosynthesis transcription factor PdxR n=1 Tax=Pseudovibrio flavus TaxID=2529854 RepID=UPI0012BBAB86|nr:PLP-dependent aminotransferase family protein [Pseudovibrio flavus]MTI18097.1 PLP-dependent aminotransferase family protein [Pseudovibrio flavus]